MPEEQSGSPRRRALTPEQRRLLNRPRVLSPNESSEQSAKPPADPPSPDPSEPESIPLPSVEEAASASHYKQRPSASGRVDLAAQSKASNAIEMRHALAVLSGLVLLAFVFFVGWKFDAIRYHLMTRLNPPKLDKSAKEFPGLSTDELIESALAAERRGDWIDATDRFLAAKRMNHSLPGILFRVGKNSFDHNDLANADYAFDYAIRFGENLPASNYFRALIAVRKHELTSAAQFLEAAANADPFVAEYYYHWAEVLRLDHRPREAIRRYEQALQRTSNPSYATLCIFKIRLARLEAVEASALAEEVAANRQSGPLSVDWLMTDAALQLQAGKIPATVQLIEEARAKGMNGLFMTCGGDVIFQQGAASHPEIAAALKPPTPEATPSTR